MESKSYNRAERMTNSTDKLETSAVPKQERAYRPVYEKMFFPFGLFLSKFVTANFVSYFGVILAIFSMISFYLARNGEFLFIYLALLFMGLSSLADMLDGSVARAEKAKGKKIGKFGALLDPVADRYAEVFFLLGILFSSFTPPEYVFFCFAGMIMASYTRARAESLGPDKDGNKLFISTGIERKEKLSFLAIGAFIHALAIQTQLDGWVSSVIVFNTLTWSVIVVAILSHLAAIQRLNLAKKYLIEVE